MAKVSIASVETALPTGEGEEWSGGESATLFAREGDPIHVYVHTLNPGERLRLAAGGVDRAIYVWHGSVTARGERLDAGSSLIAERGAEAKLETGGEGTTLLTFRAAQPEPVERAGGRLHLLPSAQVPRYRGEGHEGGLHANAGCPTCSVWLHENRFDGVDGISPAVAEGGIHSHSENEVIFVTGGQIRLGARLFGPGTAVAIAAEAMYSFTPGPGGLSFLNFRAGLPAAIRFKNGTVIDEVGYWRERVPAPVYL